jgi:hypothetical protein
VQHKHSDLDVAEYNLISMLAAFETGAKYQMPAEKQTPPAAAESADGVTDAAEADAQTNAGAAPRASGATLEAIDENEDEAEAEAATADAKPSVNAAVAAAGAAVDAVSAPVSAVSGVSAVEPNAEEAALMRGHQNRAPHPLEATSKGTGKGTDKGTGTGKGKHADGANKESAAGASGAAASATAEAALPTIEYSISLLSGDFQGMPIISPHSYLHGTHMHSMVS